MKLLRPIDKALQRFFPQLYYNLIQRPRVARQFRAERQLSLGVQLSQSRHRGILFFTTQKCASRYVGGILGRLASAEGMLAVDYDAYIAMSAVPKWENPFSADGTRSIAFPSQGYLFGPIGRFHAVPQFKTFATLLQLRDPRDVLTSLYFSTAYSHALISQKSIRRRKQALQMSVDEYVLKQVDVYQAIYARYAAELLAKPTVLFLKYEDMVGNFENWLQQVSEHIGLNHYTHVLREIREEANFEVGKEDKYSQKRQVSPGDHRRKLQPETIAELNSRLGSLLETFGYRD